jgi:hypothetical protein
MRMKGVFNLVFGDLRADGTIDDNVVSDNKDRNKILKTVAMAVFDFTQRFPDRYVYFEGSTPARNRLYRMTITTNLEELSKTLSIWGIIQNNDFESFQKQGNYTGFLTKRK